MSHFTYGHRLHPRPARPPRLHRRSPAASSTRPSPARQAPRHIVTADASMAVIARRDPDLRDIVAGADLVTPDGAGILWASRLLRTPITHKVSGVDLVGHACRLSAERGWRIFFLGRGPRRRRGGCGEPARPLSRRTDRRHARRLLHARSGAGRSGRVKAAMPDVLLVAFGIPKQEKWITRHKADLNVPVSVGIGGSFDVYSGRVQRAPSGCRNTVWSGCTGWRPTQRKSARS